MRISIWLFVLLSSTASVVHAAVVFDDAGLWANAVGTGLIQESFGSDIAFAQTIMFSSGASANGEQALGMTNNEVLAGQWRLRVYNAGGVNGFARIDILLPEPVNAFGIFFESVSSSRGFGIGGAWDGAGTVRTDLWTHFGNASSGFFGVVGTAPFDLITLDATGGSVVGDDLVLSSGFRFPVPDRIFTSGFED